MSVPQLTIWLSPSGTLVAESTASNGSRKKIELPEGMELTAIRAELLEQRDNIRKREEERKAKELAERSAIRKRVWENMLAKHPRTAEKVMPYMRVKTAEDWGI